jgi:hypothetical protein
MQGFNQKKGEIVNMSESELPKFFTANHIKKILHISYNEADKLLDLNVLPVIGIGNSKRVLVSDFHRWLSSRTINKYVN